MSAKRILVITDDVALWSLLRVCLRGNGHQLEIARNGLVAVAKLNQTLHDVILLDYDRAEIGGMAILQHIHDHHDIPVVLMLEHDSPFAAQLPTALGAQALVKPFDPQAVEQILNFLPRSSRHRPASWAQCDLRLDGQKRLRSDRQDQSRTQEMASGRKDSA